jgi:Integrase core domain
MMSSFFSPVANASRRLRRRSMRPDGGASCPPPRLPRQRRGEMSMPMMAIAVLPALSFVTKQEPAGNTTQTDPRSQRIRESRTGRPDNEIELPAHLPTAACPHFTCSRCPTSRMVTPYANPQRSAGRRRTTAYIPNNGHVERLIGSIRRECLDHVVVLGEAHLRQTLRAYADYYNRARSHLALAKDAPIARPVQTEGAIAACPSSEGSITSTFGWLRW